MSFPFVTFPVTDLDAYERRFRRNGWISGIAFLLLGVGFLAMDVPDEIGLSTAILVGLMGAFIGVVSWVVRRPGTALGSRLARRPMKTAVLPDWRRRETWTVIAIEVAIVLAILAIVMVVLQLFDADLPLRVLGGGGWMTIAVTLLLEAPEVARMRRQRYEADLKELAELPAPPRPEA